MKLIMSLIYSAYCRICNRTIENVGAGTNCNGMCERCYENGGDDE